MQFICDATMPLRVRLNEFPHAHRAFAGATETRGYCKRGRWQAGGKVVGARRNQRRWADDIALRRQGPKKK